MAKSKKIKKRAKQMTKSTGFDFYVNNYEGNLSFEADTTAKVVSISKKSKTRKNTKKSMYRACRVDIYKLDGTVFKSNVPAIINEVSLKETDESDAVKANDVISCNIRFQQGESNPYVSVYRNGGLLLANDFGLQMDGINSLLGVNSPA